jgi:hypothetical protein
VKHSAYLQLDLLAAAAAMRTPLIVDARGAFSTLALRAAGFRHRTIGVGQNAHSEGAA